MPALGETIPVLRALILLVLLCLPSLGACGRESSTPTTTPRASDRTLPRLPGVPALPMPFDTSSGTFQRLWEKIGEALELELPPPVTRSEAAYRRWVDTMLADWLSERARAIDAALVRQRALRESSSTERLIAHALVAWLCQRTAEDVLDAELPGEDPARAARLREAWRDRMEPVRERAREHFAACIELGTGGAIEAQAWVDFCRERERQVAPSLRETEE